ncbi:MAG: hypothetical protein JSS68_11700 [Actinobacteria bacterium]|nr:hypothetical protein [Actinomycetota bacterium]
MATRQPTRPCCNSSVEKIHVVSRGEIYPLSLPAVRPPQGTVLMMLLLGALCDPDVMKQLGRLHQIQQRLLKACADSPPSSTPRPPRYGDIPQAVCKVLAEADAPLSIAAVHAAVEQSLEGPVNYSSVKATLTKGARMDKPRFKRVEPGYYRLA